MCDSDCVCVEIDRYLGIRGIDCGLRTPSFPSWQPVCVCVCVDMRKRIRVRIWISKEDGEETAAGGDERRMDE